jgi:2,4-dienoyl-CoA reductase-like NADH-dependent reductase (Old Yellow Enzyme family)
MAVHPTSQPRRGVILAYDPRVIDSYRKVAEAVQPHGTLLIAQLWHRGRETDGQVSRPPPGRRAPCRM